MDDDEVVGSCPNRFIGRTHVEWYEGFLGQPGRSACDLPVAG